jgi:hypothetical protein
MKYAVSAFRMAAMVQTSDAKAAGTLLVFLDLLETDAKLRGQ